MKKQLRTIEELELYLLGLQVVSSYNNDLLLAIQELVIRAKDYRSGQHLNEKAVQYYRRNVEATNGRI